MQGLIDLIKRHEGYSESVYHLNGVPHIGYGHNLRANPLNGYIDFYFSTHGCITQDMAEYLMDRKVIEAGKWAEMMILNWSELTTSRRMVIVSMIYILGSDGFMNFRRFRDAVHAGDWDTAADEIVDSLMYRQLGGDPPGTDDGVLERPEELVNMMREG